MRKMNTFNGIPISDYRVLVHSIIFFDIVSWIDDCLQLLALHIVDDEKSQGTTAPTKT